jgi:hypothetical protein
MTEYSIVHVYVYSHTYKYITLYLYSHQLKVIYASIALLLWIIW